MTKIDIYKKKETTIDNTLALKEAVAVKKSKKKYIFSKFFFATENILLAIYPVNISKNIVSASYEFRNLYKGKGYLYSVHATGNEAQQIILPRNKEIQRNYEIIKKYFRDVL